MQAAKLQIRPFRKEDSKAVIVLWSSVFKNDPPWNEPSRIIEKKSAYQAELFLVGTCDKNVIATVLGGYDGFRGWIYHLAVAAQFQRRGVAKLMMAAIEEKLKELGCIKINLQIRSSNQDVINFYRKLGYTIEDHISMGKHLI
jgi:ribosomal protein S18 acetylase RimI-like enzyme